MKASHLNISALIMTAMVLGACGGQSNPATKYEELQNAAVRDTDGKTTVEQEMKAGDLQLYRIRRRILVRGPGTWSRVLRARHWMQ